MTSPTPPPAYSALDAPPLPPRRSSSDVDNSANMPDPSIIAMSSNDPRSSSAQSLVPQNEERSGRRRLLLVFIHGFFGDETSFRSFPAHVHNLVSITLADSHIVHTKIYPKYKSRYALEVARDDFSKWYCLQSYIHTRAHLNAGSHRMRIDGRMLSSLHIPWAA
jgi:hypothetical protein